MRASVLATTCTTVFLVGAAASASPVATISFATPATLAGTILSENGHWALITFSEHSELGGFFAVRSPLHAERINETLLGVREAIGKGEMPLVVPREATQGDFANASSEIHQSEGVGSLFVAADNISLSYQTDDAQLAIIADGEPVESFVGLNDSYVRSGRYSELVPGGGPVLSSSISRILTLHARGVHLIETHDIAFVCSITNATSLVCPNGDDRQSVSGPRLAVELQVTALSFHRFVSTNGTLDVVANNALVATGGEPSSVAVDGHSRFPATTLNCANCSDISGHTFQVEGLISLHNLKTADDNKLISEFWTQASTGQVDERQIQLPNIFGSGYVMVAGVAGIGLMVLKFLIAPFFTRLTKEEAQIG